jgi:hypothetical protein
LVILPKQPVPERDCLEQCCLKLHSGSHPNGVEIAVILFKWIVEQPAEPKLEGWLYHSGETVEMVLPAQPGNEAIAQPGEVIALGLLRYPF